MPAYIGEVFLGYKMSVFGLRLRQWVGMAVIAGLFLLVSAFWSISTIQEGLTCKAASQVCYYQRHYLWMSHNVMAFRFSDVQGVSTVFLGQGKDGKHYGILFDLGQLPTVILKRPSSYIANREIPKLKTYLKHPQASDFSLAPVISWAGIFLMLLPLVAGLAACQSMYKATLKANQEKAALENKRCLQFTHGKAGSKRP